MLSIVALGIAGASWWLVGTATRAEDAYARCDWQAAERAARQELKVRPEDPDALRVLARSSARLGRDEIAIALYSQHLAPGTMEAEDFLLLGMALQRQKQPEAAARAWKGAMRPWPIPTRVLEELARVLIQHHQREESARAAERLAREPGWEARGEMMLGTIRAGLGDVAGAAASFRAALTHDPKEIDNSADPVGLGKLVARTFLRVGRAADARLQLRAILDRKPEPESWWLLSRAYLQEGDIERARDALTRSGSYRAEHPMENEPGPYVGEARCASCHARIVRDSLASRHTQSYYRGDQLQHLPRPERPLPDPDDPRVTHAIRLEDGRLLEETRDGSQVFRAVIEYAFGTADRYLTMVARDADGGYRTARISYYQTPEGRGWDRTALDKIHPTRADEFQGERIGVRDGVAKCLYCHATNPRSGRELTGPEASDRAVGCERCHGPGGPHLAAVAAGFPDVAIANPAMASPKLVTEKQCNDCHILGRDFREDLLDDPTWVRSQGVGWIFSRCNTESGGAAGCVTCHDPHKPASATTTAQYEAKCLSCHSTKDPGQRPCPVNASRDCLGCHMPRVRMNALHLSLTDHYIRIRKNAATAAVRGEPIDVPPR